MEREQLVGAGFGMGGALLLCSRVCAGGVGQRPVCGRQFLDGGRQGFCLCGQGHRESPVLAIEGDGDGGYFIRFSGVPGLAYRLERAPGLTGPWAASAPATAPPPAWSNSGTCSRRRTRPSYRSVQP